MSGSTLFVKKMLSRQKIFKDQEDQQDPENPVFVPKSMKVKTSISYPKECEGDAFVLELQEKQSALNKEYMIQSAKNCSVAKNCSAAVTRALEIAID